MAGLLSLLPDFSETDKERLQELGVVDKQIHELRFALVQVRRAIGPKATRNGTRLLLTEIHNLAGELDRKLCALVTQPSPEYGAAGAMLEERYWQIGDRQDDDGGSIPIHLVPRLRALATCADLALESLPGQPTRNRSADPAPVRAITNALLIGWREEHGSNVFHIHEADGREVKTYPNGPQRKPYPAEFRPSAADGSTFRKIVGICYGAVGGNDDPLAALKAYLRIEREIRKESMAALEAGISSAVKKSRNRTSRKT